MVCPLLLIFEMFWYSEVYNINEYHDTMYQIVYVRQVLAIVQSSSHSIPLLEILRVGHLKSTAVS